MNRILLASALVLGVSGAALAQQAPVQIGNYSASVQSQLDRDAHQVNAAAKTRTYVTTHSTNAANIDRTTTASTAMTGAQNDGRLDDAYNR